jgi:hypothetical protein
MKTKHFCKWTYGPLTFLILVILHSGCASVGTWSQFHGDGPSQGFKAIHTTYALKPKWTLDLTDHVAFSSPVLSKDGTIYVGASDGLIKVSQDGLMLWKTSFTDARIFSSPAAGPDGNIYVVTTKKIGDKQYYSELHSVNPLGNINWTRNFGVTSDIFTSASPKIWGSEKNLNIFVYLKELYVFSQDGRMLKAGDITNHCTTVTNSSWFADFFISIGKGFESFFTGEAFTFDVSAINWDEIYGWPDPTVAIVSYPNMKYVREPFSKFETEPLIVAANYCTISGVRWKPEDQLVTMWGRNLPDPKKTTSPAGFPNGILAIGREDGLVELFDVETGVQQAQYNAREKIVGTPASLLGITIYVASKRNLHVISANGNPLNILELKGETLASPAVTADAVYVSTTAGLESFALDFSAQTIDKEARGGVSSPTVGPDGTIYMITESGQLRAYPREK